MQEKIEQFSQQIQQSLADESLLLPSLPDIALRVRDACDREDSSSQNIAAQISQDPALSARLLKVANSSLYCSRSQVDNINTAITRLGIKQVKNLVIGLALKQLYLSSSHVIQERFHELWLASTKTAALSRLLASQCDKLNPEQAMLAGLTHNIGALPILLLAEDDDELFENPEDLYSIIHRMQGQVSRYIFKSWNFPDFMLAVAKDCYHFDRNHEGPADYTDVIQVALVEGSIYTGLTCPDSWADIPAFKQLNINPETSILEIDDNRIVYEETSSLFM